MSQTVVFKYAKGARVRVLGDVCSKFKGQKGVVAELRFTGEWRLFKVVFEGGGYDLLRSYHLEPDLSEPEAPAPTFPRVIWRGTLEGDVCYRIVFYRPKELVVEQQYRDAMGDVKWNDIGWGDQQWSRAVSQALMEHEAELDGSSQTT